MLSFLYEWPFILYFLVFFFRFFYLNVNAVPLIAVTNQYTIQTLVSAGKYFKIEIQFFFNNA